MTPQPGLSDFLLARIANDEESAREALNSWFTVDCNGTDNAGHYYRQTPERVLARCAALRQLVDAATHADQHADDNGDPYNHGEADALRDALRLLALAYADHADYLPEWRP